jgi:hypothetical protein
MILGTLAAITAIFCLILGIYFLLSKDKSKGKKIRVNEKGRKLI